MGRSSAAVPSLQQFYYVVPCNVIIPFATLFFQSNLFFKSLIDEA